MRRSVGVDVDGVLASVATAATDGGPDEVADRILDAASELFTTLGVRRVSVDDIAARSGVGRTTVYRRFDGRNQIVEAVLAREVRRFFTSILVSTAHLDRFEDVVVESFLTGLRAGEASLLATLVRAEPELLALLTIDGGPIVGAARDFLVAAYGAREPHVEMVAEVLVRLAISLVLTPETSIPLADDEAARVALHHLFDPLLTPLA